MKKFLVIKMTDWISKTLYPNGVMKNKLGITDEKELADTEFLLSSRNAVVLLKKQPRIKDISYLKKIHEFMFTDLYDWAGQYRPGDFQKNGYQFFEHTRFSFAEANINNIITSQPANQGLQATDYAKLLDEINYMHPFREGNGRSCKVFLLAYAANHKQTIDYPRKNQEMIVAQNQADVNAISKLIKVEDTPSREAAFKQLIRQRMNSRLR